MKRWIQPCFFLCLGLMLLVGSADAAPSTIAIQGKLTSAAGRPLPGTRAWRVKFYDALTGGNPVGAAIQGTVGVAASGRFAIELALPASVLAFDGALYYELAVDSAATPDGTLDAGDVFPARVKINSVLFAQRLARQGIGSGVDADLLDGSHAGAFVTTASLAGLLTLKADAGHSHQLQDLGGAVTDAQVPDNITITEADTLASVTGRGNSTAQPLDLTSPTDSASSVTGALKVAGGVGIQKNLNVGGQLNVAGQLYYGGAKAFTWAAIAADTQAESNCGYLVGGASPTTVTLPLAPAVGDVVRVSGIGAGGWNIAQNAGQKILLGGLDIPNPQAWTARLTDANRYWTAMAASADGTHLVAGALNDSTLYTSSDSGTSWTARLTDASRGWTGMASSTDGTRLAACAYGGDIYTSSDSGATWTPRNVIKGWQSIASSADGTRLAACANGDSIYTSSDSGATWTPRMTGITPYWHSIASSADGTRLAAGIYGGCLYTSSDSGATWTARLTDANRNWVTIASSADGTRLAACADGGCLYTSSDSGATWTPRMTDANRFWRSLAVSADGTRLAACAYDGGVYKLYVSSDTGATWTPWLTDATRPWVALTVSADGTRLTAGAYNGYLYTWRDVGPLLETTAGTAGSLSGGRGSAVELQHIGGGLFMPLSHNGSLVAN